MKLTRNKIRKLHKQKIQSLKRIKYGNKPKHHKKHNNTFRQKNRVDYSDGNKNINHLFNKTLKSYIPAKELARINKKYKENRYQRRIRKMIPDGKRNGIMTGGAYLPLPDGWEVLFDTQNRPYYGNQTLKITQWVYPGVLPPGWEVLFDANRQPFYGNPTLNITQYDFPSPATTPGLSPVTTPSATAAPMDESTKENDEAAAEAKLKGECNNEIKTPYAQTINLQVKADDDGEMSIIVNPVSTGIDGLSGILNRGQEPVTPAPADIQAGGQQPPVTPGNTAAVGGARHTRRKYAKRGNKRKMTIRRK